MDSELVSLVLNNKAQAALNLAVEKYGEKSVSYCGESIHVGRNMAASLSVTWVPSDELFQIREGEDGTETIILFRDMQFLRA